MRRKRYYPAARAFGVVAAAVVLGGCATKGDIRSLQTEMRLELQAQAARQDSLMAMLRREAISTQDTLRTQSDQLFDFRGDITRLLQALTQGQSRLEALVGETQRGMAALRGQAGTNRVSTGPATTRGVSTDSTQAPGTETVQGVGGNADQLYGVARDLHQRGSLSAAQQAYEQFLRDHASDVRAPDARFYLADILSQQNRPDDALAAFQEIAERYPTAARVPDALFRMARIQADLGNTADARRTLERIVNTFPDSGVAFLARDMLEEIR
ncbi:MAG: tetratricopeptide repeat protein [Gemmatimonadota bacterium]|nr:tetratricopeptide repeat protein [Gemmatimonadota bacterium]MDH3423377.1 tetratricopeptide repeat protein [Gemmatimonadota bacterium]